MDSPVRKMQKRNDYNRHKLFRKIRRKRRAQAEQLSRVAEKELKKKLRVTPVKYDDGKTTGYVRDKNDHPIAFDEEGNLIDQVTGEKGIMNIPEVTISPSRYTRDLYSSAFDTNAPVEFINAITAGGLNNLSPTQWARRAYDTVGLINGDMSQGQYIDSWINGNNGIVTNKFAQEHPYWSTGINMAGDAFTFGLGQAVKSAGKEGLQHVAKAVDNTARYMSPSYDLYRTIGETTPRTTPTLHVFYTDGLTKNGYHVYDGSPMLEFGHTMRTSPEKAYFMRAPKDVDILKLGNGRFRHEVVGNTIVPSGEVNGKFVSYGEPWKEFALGENSALYEFPVGPGRGPSMMATDWKGRPQKYSVDEIYDYMLKENNLREGLHRDVVAQGLDKLKGMDRVKAYEALKQEKYPELLQRYNTSIYGANQTVIPNERWNFDKFLKTPFWKYSENPISGQVQKELMMRWPEAKSLETPAMEWAEAIRAAQTAAKNASGYNLGKTTSGIHIKPSHRGRLTALKKRTGKSEAELYRTGSAATRKMITFARNARKWNK